MGQEPGLSAEDGRLGFRSGLAGLCRSLPQGAGDPDDASRHPSSADKLMNVVFVASEAVPFAKTGGLADVAGALPRALEKQGHSTLLFMPCYRRVWSAGPELVDTGLILRIPVGARWVEGQVYES